MIEVLATFIVRVAEELVKQASRSSVMLPRRRRDFLSRLLRVYNSLDAVYLKCLETLDLFDKISRDSSVLTRTECYRALRPLQVAFEQLKNEIASTEQALGIFANDVRYELYSVAYRGGGLIKEHLKKLDDIDLSGEVVPRVIDSAEGEAGFRLRVLLSYPELNKAPGQQALPVLDGISMQQYGEEVKGMTMSQFIKKNEAEFLKGFEFEVIDMRDKDRLKILVQESLISVQKVLVAKEMVANVIRDNYNVNDLFDR